MISSILVTSTTSTIGLRRGCASAIRRMGPELAFGLILAQILIVLEFVDVPDCPVCFLNVKRLECGQILDSLIRFVSLPLLTS